MAKKARTWLKLILFVLFFFVLFFVLKKVFQPVSSQQIISFFQSWGILGILIYVPIVFTATVISPLGSFPFWPFALLVYGPFLSGFYTALGSILGATVNFFVAKRLGRPIMEKLISKKGLQLVDRISFKSGLRTLFFLRIIPGGMFDYVSYASGLVSLPFWPYLLITAFFSVFYNLIYFYFVLGKALELLGMGTLLIFGYLGAVISILVSYFKEKKKQFAKIEEVTT